MLGRRYAFVKTATTTMGNRGRTARNSDNEANGNVVSCKFQTYNYDDARLVSCYVLPRFLNRIQLAKVTRSSS